MTHTESLALITCYQTKKYFVSMNLSNIFFFLPCLQKKSLKKCDFVKQRRHCFWTFVEISLFNTIGKRYCENAKQIQDNYLFYDSLTFCFEVTSGRTLPRSSGSARVISKTSKGELQQERQLSFHLQLIFVYASRITKSVSGNLIA